MSAVAVAHPAVACQWPERRFSSVARQRKDVGHSDLELLSVFLDRGVIRYSESAGQVHKPSQDLSAYQRVLPGDLVMNNQQAWRGSVGVSQHEGIVSPAYLVWELSGTLDPRYAKYLFRSEPLRHQFVRASKGVGSIQRTVSLPLLKSAVVPVPSLDEQALLARYLDNIDLSISRATRSKRDLASLLLESRDQAIWDALTDVADGNTQVLSQWMGPVPASFALTRLKSHLREVNNRTSSGLEELLSLRMREGLVPSADYSRAAPTSEQLVGYKKVRPGDLVMNRMRASIGLFGIADREGLVSPDYAVFEARSDVHLPFLLHLLKSRHAGAIIRAESRGMGTGSAGFLRIYTDRFGTIPVALPPPEEQRRRAAEASARVEHIDRAIASIEEEIELLREYRTRLIADVVIGRLDVRAEAAVLPEVDPEEIAEAQAADDIAEDMELEVAHAD